MLKIKKWTVTFKGVDITDKPVLSYVRFDKKKKPRVLTPTKEEREMIKC